MFLQSLFSIGSAGKGKPAGVCCRERFAVAVASCLKVLQSQCRPLKEEEHFVVIVLAGLLFLV